MNTKMQNGLLVGNDVSLRTVQQAAGVHETLMRRLMVLLDATMRETWLPMSFRALVVQEFPEMRRELERRRSIDGVSRRIGILVEAADPYRAFEERSEAFVTLKLLSAELRAGKIAA